MKDSTTSHHRLLSALHKALTPLANALLKIGVSYRQFDDVAKKAFVSAACANHGKRDRPANTSHVSRITGISRRNVARLKECLGESTEHKDDRLHLLTRITDCWFTDTRFCDDGGKPMSLALSGATNSIEQLCSILEADMPPEDVRVALLEAGTITKVGEDEYLPIRQWVRGTDASSRLETALFMPLYSLASTIDHNMTSPRAQTRLERVVHMQVGEPESLKKLRNISQERCQNLLESVNDLYGAYEPSAGFSSSSETKIVGVGVFYFEHDEYWHTQSRPILRNQD